MRPSATVCDRLRPIATLRPHATDRDTAAKWSTYLAKTRDENGLELKVKGVHGTRGRHAFVGVVELFVLIVY